MKNQELNKKLAKWAKLEDGLGLDRVPNFTESLDACFKWLVPRLFENGLFISLIADKRFCRVTILSGIFDRKDKVEAVGENKDPALALCLAIEKLIDGI